jgi:hypothetical protein
MLQTVARAINCEVFQTIALEERSRELNAERGILEALGEQLAEERRIALDNFRDDAESVKIREAYKKAQEKFDADDKAFHQRISRYLQFRKDLQKLKGIRIVASSLVWAEGYPVDGSSSLSRYFDDKPFRAALWFQAAGDTAGQAWVGPFRDTDGNGIMEFARPDNRFPAGNWTHEINFLGWRTADGITRELPAGARVRVTLQWREAHDPTPLRAGEDPYREPLAKFKLLLLYQPDPDGKKQPSDDLEVVAQSVGLPQRLAQTLNAGTYEQIIEFRIPKAGRYAIQVRGKAPEGITAAGEASLPGHRKQGEVKPRLFVETLEGLGRAVWTSYPTQAGSTGMPADARRVISVGEADAKARPQPSTAQGSPAGMALLARPSVLAFDEGGGTGQAAAFAAGVAAIARTLGIPFGACTGGLDVRPGGLLCLPVGRRGRE